MKFRRFLSGMMVAAMVFTSLPVSGLAGGVYAAEGDTVIDELELTTDGPKAGTYAAAVSGETSQAWKFEDTAGNDLTNSSDVTITSDSTDLTVAELDGRQAYSGQVKVKDSRTSTNFNITGTDTPIVLSFSMYATAASSSGNQTVIGKVQQYVIQMSPTSLIFNTSADGSTFKNVTYSIDASTFYNAWHDIVAVYTGGDTNALVLYVDGTLVGSVAVADGGLADRDDPFTIGYNGKDSTKPSYPGYLADVVMYTGGNEISATATVDEITASLESRTKVLDIEAQAQKTARYEVSETTWYAGIGTEGDVLSGSTAFVDNTDYTLKTVLTATEGYVFDDTTAAAITTGESSLEPESATVGDDGSTLTLVYYFLSELSQAKLDLTKALAAAKDIYDAGNTSGYSEESWSAFSTAYGTAAQISAEETDVSIISAAAADLAAAQAALATVKLTADVYLPAESLTATADSYETVSDSLTPSLAVDGDSESYWHTNWKDDSAAKPSNDGEKLTGNNNLYIELDGKYTVSGIRYLPRPSHDSSSGTINNGAIVTLNVYVATAKDADDEWEWTQVVAEYTWDSYPSSSSYSGDYTDLRRYIEFNAVENVQAVRIEAINTAGPVPNKNINAAEVDVLATYNLTDKDDELAFELYDAICANDIQTVLNAGNDDNTWTDASWSSFVSAYNDALETFQDLYDTTAADGTVFTAAKSALETAYAALEAPCLCTITLNSLGIEGVTGDVLALEDAESMQYTLTADYSVAANGCTRTGHTDNTEGTAVYSVTGSGASLSGTTLTVANTATTVTVKVTVSYNDAETVSATAQYTVTSNRVKNQLSDDITEAEAITQGTKTDEAWQTLQDAIAAAKAVLDDENATDTDRTRAITALEAAIAAFNSSSDAETPGGETQTDDETAKSELYTKLDALINTANAKIAEQNASKTYTTESINALQTALNTAVNTYNKAVVDGHLYLDNVTLDELTSAYDALDKAISGLVTASDGATTTPAPATTTTPQVGDEVSSGIYVYKVTGADTVEIVKLSDSGKNQTKLKIFNTVKLGGVTFKVTSIAKNAFKGNKKIKSVVIGKNITTIGAKAFNGCTKLKKVTVKSKVLKTVGKAAFKKTSAKLTVKVPKAKKKAYKKLLKKGGVKASRVK